MSKDWQLTCMKCELPLTIEEILNKGCPQCGGTAFYTKHLKPPGGDDDEEVTQAS